MKSSRRSLSSCLTWLAPLLLLPALAHADRASLATDPELRQWLYGGVNAGVSTVSPDRGLRESDKNGSVFGARFLVSKYWRDIVADVGLGYAVVKVEGTDRFNPTPNSKVRVSTRAGFFELSPRYRFDEHWQLGLVANLLFGSDVSFDERTGQDSNIALLGGPRLNFEWGTQWLRFRVGAQAQWDLTIGNRGTTWVQGDFQIGFPFGGAPEAEPAPAPPVEPAPVVAKRPVAPKFAEAMPEARAVKIYLGEAVLRFKTNRSDLRPSSREILAKVAKYLKKSPKAWEKMRVEGHSDKRGRLAYNDMLSLKRAQSVAKELGALGIPKTKMASKGFGPRQPIDPAEDLEAYALNRRVELWLDGVTDPDSITRDLNELK